MQLFALLTKCEMNSATPSALKCVVDAFVEGLLVSWWQRALASVSSVLVDCRIISAVNNAVAVAVRAEASHVALNRLGRTVGLVHTIGIG